MRHLVNWVEIPVQEMPRAREFYGAVFGVELQTMSMGNAVYAIFPTDDRFNAGALVKSDDHRPGSDGVGIYLDGSPDLSALLDRVRRAGGKVVLEKTYLGKDAGNIGLFLDTEGNRIGLQHP